MNRHLNPFLALASKLKARGHQPVYFGPVDCSVACRAAGIDFVAHSEQEFPMGAVAEAWEPVAHLQGMKLLERALTQINPRLLAAGIAYHGVGEFLEIEQLTDTTLSDVLERVLTTSSYRERVTRFKQILAGIDGLELGAGIIEQALGSEAGKSHNARA